MRLEPDHVLQAIAARFYCIEELINNGDLKGALSIIKHCKKVLPEPEEVNMQSARMEAIDNG